MVLFAAFQLLQAETRAVVRIQRADSATIRKFSQNKYDIAAINPGNFIDLVVNDAEKQLLEREYPLTVTQTEEQLKEAISSNKAINGYKEYNQMLTELQQLVNAHPSILKLVNLGSSTGKLYSATGNSAYNNYQHDIWALKLSDNVNVEEDEPNFYFMGAHHAREPISMEMNLKILHALVDNYTTNSAMKQRVDNSQIWFIPLINPNGHKIVLDQTDVWWRKNIRDNNQNNLIDQGGNAYFASVDGVDLNRNYDFEWGGEGASADFDDHTYRGPSAFSEPELQAVNSILTARHFVAGISYHTYSELVLYPYGYASGINAPDHLALKSLAENMAATIPKQNGGTYTPQSSWALYPCSGTTDDYAYGKFGTFSYTIEMATEFIPPAAQSATIQQNNLAAAMLLIDRTKNSILTGKVTDGANGTPVSAEISIESIDNSTVYRAPYKSDAAFGRYYRLLMPGSYTVKVKAYGYQTRTLSGVQINNSNVTELNVQLIKDTGVTISGKVRKSSDNLPIENAMIEILNTPQAPAFTNSSGYYTMPGVSAGTYTARISAAGYQTKESQILVSISTNQFFFTLDKAPEAWTPLLSEGFESTAFPPANWQNSNPGWNSSTENHSGTRAAKTAYSPAGTRTLTTPSIQCGSSAIFDSLRLKFWWKDDDLTKIAGHDSTYLEISTNNGASWTVLAVLSDSFSSSIFKEAKVNLTACLGQSIKLRWRDKSNGSLNAYGCGLDDIVLEGKPKPSSITENGEMCKTAELYQNYPNPFNPLTKISYRLKTAGFARVTVYNAKGELLKILSEGLHNPGDHSVDFDGTALNSGLYFYKLETASTSQISRMLLLK